MKQVFQVGEGFKVPDGTFVHSALDPRSAATNRVSGIDNLSLAIGVIPPGVSSAIHLHPIVTQATWVLSGALTVKMKDAHLNAPYELQLSPEQSALTLPGTFFQLQNRSSQECRVLYVVTPAFIFEVDPDGKVLYNDALVLQESWQELAKARQ
jgi:uncharacterized cupin superfamily protein